MSRGACGDDARYIGENQAANMVKINNRGTPSPTEPSRIKINSRGAGAPAPHMDLALGMDQVDQEEGGAGYYGGGGDSEDPCPDDTSGNAPADGG
jgi:hypothetical protein